MVEFADQLHRPFERKKAAVAMVADVHHPPTGRTSTIEDVEFPKSEIGIQRSLVRHPANLSCPGTIRRLRRHDSEDTPKNPVILATCQVIDIFRLVSSTSWVSLSEHLAFHDFDRLVKELERHVPIWNSRS